MKNSLTEKGLSAAVFWLPLVSVIMYAGLLFSFFTSFPKFRQPSSKTSLDYAIAVFIAVIFLSAIASVDKIQSAYGFILFCAYPIAYIIFSRNTNEESLAGMVKTGAMALVLVLILAFVQVLIPVPFLNKYGQFFNLLQWTSDVNVFKGARFVSTFANPNVLGAYLVLVLPVLCSLFLHKLSFKKGILLAVGIITLVLTYSRSSWIGFLAGILMISILSRKRIFLFIVLALLLLIVSVPLLNTRFIESSFNSLTVPFGRLHIWKASIDIIKHYPLLGSGPNTFFRVFPYPQQHPVELISHAHNIVLQLGAETGLLGIAAFFAIVILFFICAFRVYRKMQQNNSPAMTRWTVLGITGGMFGFMVQNFFDYFLSRGQIGVLFFAFIGMIRGLDSLENNVKS